MNRIQQEMVAMRQERIATQQKGTQRAEVEDADNDDVIPFGK